MGRRKLSAQNYADEVNNCLGLAAQLVIDAGSRLIDAKQALDHGQWLTMFKGHPQHVERPLKFGARAAQMLMKVAKHPVLSDANHGSLLPASWRTCYELTKVPEPYLRAAIANGQIHPGMERKEAGDLHKRGAVQAQVAGLEWKTALITKAAEYDERRASTIEAKPLLPWMDSPVSRCYSGIAAQLEGVVFDLSPEDCAELFTLLRTRLDDLERRVAELAEAGAPA